MKRVSVKITISCTNQDDPKDTVDTVVAYGDMSLESFHTAQRAVSEALFKLGDAVVEMNKHKHALK